MSLPIFDLHCDLLSYLARVPKADAMKTDDIGCAIPHLQKGNVKLQILAMFTATKSGSSKIGMRESLEFQKLLKEYGDKLQTATDVSTLKKLPTSQKIGVLAAIENASGFCEEDDKLKDGLKKLEKLIKNVERILYISLTHHDENRFGGGNLSKNVGLKKDGEALLEYVEGRKIAVDLSHTSDALAHDILNYTNKKNLNIPISASHSNFRKIFVHPRNLLDEIAEEIIARGGIIGINFIKDFLNPKKEEALIEHILYGIEKWDDCLCFGADFFCTKEVPEQEGHKVYWEQHQDASKYPAILQRLGSDLSTKQLEGLAFRNALTFIDKIWTEN